MDDNSFYAIDNLVEFGMGMAIAQQMVKTMNHSIQNMNIAGTQNSFNSDTSISFFAVINEKQVGPVSSSEVIRLIKQKSITNSTFIWHLGMQDWKRAEDTPAILKLLMLNTAPPPIPSSI